MAAVTTVGPKPLAASTIAEWEAAGASTVIGTVVNPAGLTLAKTVPLRRIAAFAGPGLGASPVWHVFAIDQTGIVFGEGTGVIGDQRIRIDPAALRDIGDGLVWAPGDFFGQDGSPDPYCSRGALQRVRRRLADAGLESLVGHELEFVLVGPDGAALPSASWAQYGLAGVLEYEGFVREVIETAARCGLPIEQLHPEYGVNQFEISLAPAEPVTAADQVILARMLVSRVARRHGLRVSLSPVPFAGSVGSGAHQHVSLTRHGTAVFSGGTGARGMTSDGESAIAGLLSGLAQAQGVLCGSILSGLRTQPGHWSGAHVCWGTENREAAVRFLLGGPSNPYGAHVEIKIVDPSANPYLASAAILGLALDGIARGLPLPPEVGVDPAALSDAQRADAGVTTLPAGQADVLDVLQGSELIRDILGEAVVDATVAVRQYEQQTYADLTDDQLAERFRLAWSL